MPALLSQPWRGSRNSPNPQVFIAKRGDCFGEWWGGCTSHLFVIQHGQSFHSCQDEILGNFSPKPFHADKKHPGGPQPVTQTLLTGWQNSRNSPNHWRTKQGYNFSFHSLHWSSTASKLEKRCSNPSCRAHSFNKYLLSTYARHL